MNSFQEGLSRGLFAYLLDLANFGVLCKKVLSTLCSTVLASKKFVAHSGNENFVSCGFAFSVAAAFAALFNLLFCRGSAASLFAFRCNFHLPSNL